jgi:asparagine synthase (glutamine-hydrolysing)
VFLSSRCDYVDELLAPARLQQDGIFDAPSVERLLRKSRERSALSASDDMALVGIVSTQLLIHQFVNLSPSVAYGTAYSGTANVHHR